MDRSFILEVITPHRLDHEALQLDTEYLESQHYVESYAVRVDQHPDLVEDFSIAHAEAEAVAARFVALQRQGSEVPRAVDSMSDAYRAVVALSVFGESSKEYQDSFTLLDRSVERLIGEAYSKLSGEYFSPLRHERDDASKGFVINGYRTKDMSVNGLSAAVRSEEKPRRKNDFVHDAMTYSLAKKVANGELRGKRAFYVSEIPDYILDEYNAHTEEQRKTERYGGYVPPTKKMAIVMFSFDEEARYQEQLMVPGTVLSHDVVLSSLRSLGAIGQHDVPTKEELHGMLFTVDESVAGSALDIASLLDTTAAAMHGQDYFLGNPGQGDYAAVPMQAELRRKQQEEDKENLRNYMMKLAAQGVSYEECEKRVAGLLSTMAHERSQSNPEIAAIIFGVDTANGYAQVLALEEAGYMEEAMQLRLKTMEEAPSVAGYCEAGSCGLVDANIEEATAASKAGLTAINGKYIKDVKRPCRACHKMTIVYGNEGAVCTGKCGASKINGVVVVPKDNDAHKKEPTLFEKAKGVGVTESEEENDEEESNNMQDGSKETVQQPSRVGTSQSTAP